MFKTHFNVPLTLNAQKKKTCCTLKMQLRNSMHTHKKNLLHIRNPTMYLHIKASAGQPPGSPKTLGTKRSHKNMQVKKKKGGGRGREKNFFRESHTRKYGSQCQILTTITE